MTHTLIGILFIALGAIVTFTFWRGYRASVPRTRPRMDPSVFAVMDIRAPAYRVKPLIQPLLPKSRRNALSLENNITEPRPVSPVGLTGAAEEPVEARSVKTSAALRIRPIESKEDGENQTLGL